MYEEKIGFKDILVDALWIALVPLVVHLLISTPYSFVVGFNSRGDSDAIKNAVISLGTAPIYGVLILAVTGAVAFWRVRKMVQRVYEGEISDAKKRVAWITLIPVPNTIMEGLAAAGLGIVIQTIVAQFLWLPPDYEGNMWTVFFIRLAVALVGAYAGGYLIYNQNKAAHEVAQTGEASA